MVGLQAMVLGRLGRKPSLIQERVLYPAHRHLRAGVPTPPRVRGSGPSLCPAPITHAATKTTRVGGVLQGVPAFIMLVSLVAFFPPSVLLQRGLRFVWGCALRGISGDATMTIEALVGFGFPVLPRPGFFLCTLGPRACQICT